MLVVLELSGNWKVTGKVIEWKCKEMVMETANSNHNSNKDQCQTGIYSDLVLNLRRGYKLSTGCVRLKHNNVVAHTDYAQNVLSHEIGQFHDRICDEATESSTYSIITVLKTKTNLSYSVVSH
ncbi:hypothetical protein T4E_3149 [Trichinella pseudospiralis]|uniref:Uncharacterized protein n=1 Tax=Trichinella pseudospiralis TaxID=6337 RepID=A0A0V0XHD3_TRIPS|nr:hypothetical protein T4E_3149 [Trichinella pseudospiralis]